MSGKSKLILVGLAGVVLLAYGVHRSRDSGVRTPLTGTVVVQQHGNMVLMDWTLTDARGQPVRSLRLPGGKTPAPPSVDVLDDTGRLVHRGTFQYG